VYSVVAVIQSLQVLAVVILLHQHNAGTSVIHHRRHHSQQQLTNSLLTLVVLTTQVVTSMHRNVRGLRKTSLHTGTTTVTCWASLTRWMS
jgi:hypothetical protein